ncbi:MAG: hypothetical protein QOD07_3055 [Frankiaceae bacterium]|jgi:hypothetical protein|nr:hypothetical protein [Frankiaceae bacterium]
MGETSAALGAATARIRAGDRFVRCDLGPAAGTGLDLVDRLARLRLDARRHRCRLEIRTADADLAGLLELAGLDGVVLRQR